MVDQPENPLELTNEQGDTTLPASESTQQPDPSASPADNKFPGWHEPPPPSGSSRPVVSAAWFTPDNAANVVPDADEPESVQARADALPGVAPDKTGGWFTPIDAELEALLSGAADSIVERYDMPSGLKDTLPDEPAIPPGTQAAFSSPADAAVAAEQAANAAHVSSDTQVALAADTQALATGDGLMPSPDSDSTRADEDPETLLLGSQAHLAPVTSVSGVAIEEPADSTGHSARGLSPAEVAFLAEQRAQTGQDINQDVEPAAEASSQPTSPQPATTSLEPSRFTEVERKVNVLRQRYKGGYLTREELQNELRSLMILDDDGHWWMLGLETNQWYQYDGQNWSPGTPPGHTAPVRGSGLATDTGMQQVVMADETLEEGIPERPLAQAPIEVDDSPLPSRVPQDDPGATLVSPNSPFLEPVRRSDAPTIQQARQVDESYTLASGMAGAAADQTLHSFAADAQPVGGAAIPAVTVPKPRLGEFPQPDYSAAVGARSGNPWIKWGVRLTVSGIIGGMVLTLVALVVMVVYYFYKVDQYTGAVNSLRERASTFETTLILDSDGTKLAEFSDPKTGPRQEVLLADISPWLIHATVATENETFYSDPGFSVLAIIRAAYQNVQEGDTVSGASTITQQLARALVLETEFASQRTTERKIVEIIVASEIKRKYTKNEILEIYLNEIFYGNRAYGIEAAAQTYFGKSAAELNPAEAAFLAGLPQSPATYDPVVNREAALARMNTVLGLMATANDTGCISIEHTDQTEWGVPNGGRLCVIAEYQPDTGDTLYYYQAPGMTEPAEMVLDIAYVKATNFRMPEVELKHPHFVNYVWQQLEQTYGPQAIYAAGFRVTTTLDDRVQSAAEQSVTNNLNRVRSQGYDVENASVVVTRTTDGAVLAMVGSADYYNDDIDGQVNVALTAQQPGSSIKPLLYLTAFTPDEEGNYWTPGTVIWDVPVEYQNPYYAPVNFDRQFHGPKTVREALANSFNVPAVKTLDHVGLLRFTETAEKAGLRFPFGNPVELNAGLPTALGAVDVRLFDMVTAYRTLANGGRVVQPYSIIHIEDSRGNSIYDANTSPSGDQAIQPELAFLVTSILSDNVARTQAFSPGWPMELSGGRPAAVKTGTSNDNRDLWTIGYTPQYVVGVWVGNTDNRPAYGVFTSTTATPIWNEVMEAAHQGAPIMSFTPPNGVVQMAVCDITGTQLSADCPVGSHQEYFASFAPPPGSNQGMLVTMQVDSYTGLLANEYCPNDVVTRTFLNLNDASAVTWINNSAEGQAWAATLGISLPVQGSPTAYCDPNTPRPNLVISYPPQDMVVVPEARVLPIRGQIMMPDFNRYEISYAPGHNVPDSAFSGPVLVEQTQWTTPDSILGQVDTSGLQNGPYTLRLTVFDNQGRSAKQEVRITVNNPVFPATATPAPTLTPPGALPTATLEPTPVQ